MPAPPLSNSFDGGTDGVAVSAANSGPPSGNPFDSVTSTGCVYSNVQSHSGGMAMRVVDPTVSNLVRWSALGSLTTDVFVRTYLYLSANPSTSNLNFMQVNDNAAARCAAFAITTSGFVRTLNAAAGTVATGTVAVPLNQWFRVEARIRASTTVGQIEAQLFAAPDSGVLSEALNSSALVLGANVDQFDIGPRTTLPTNPFTTYYDDVAVSATRWLGPSMIPPPAQPPHVAYLAGRTR